MLLCVCIHVHTEQVQHAERDILLADFNFIHTRFLIDKCGLDRENYFKVNMALDSEIST